MVCNVAESPWPRRRVVDARVVVDARWWWTQGGGGGARWAVDARWWTASGRQGWQETPGGGTESSRFSHMISQSQTRAGVSRLLDGRSREQLDTAEEEEEFALFADTFDDGAINTTASVAIPTASDEHGRIRESARLRAGRRHGPTLRVDST